VQKEERRTGAEVFGLSGAVGDDPLILVEQDAFGILLDARQRNGQRARDVTRGE